MKSAATLISPNDGRLDGRIVAHAFQHVVENSGFEAVGVGIVPAGDSALPDNESDLRIVSRSEAG